MADKSKIEWTDATWNPIRGCSVVSEGCRNCYAMQVAARFSGKGQAYADLAYRNESGAHWTGEVRLIEEHLGDPLRWKRPRMIFVNSMSDLFHEGISDRSIFAIFDVMYNAKQHVFQILTKRPQRMLKVISNSMYLTNAPLSNVWLGVSVEDQKTADERIPLLMQTPAAVRWISAEPLLGLIDFESVPTMEGSIDWVVVGGESGPSARPMHPDWARSLRDQCVAADVPFFFKQWGEWMPVGPVYSDSDTAEHLAALDTDDGSFDDDDPRECHITYSGYRTRARFDGQPPSETFAMRRTGKKAAGRLLDGREWNEYPDIALGGA